MRSGSKLISTTPGFSCADFGAKHSPLLCITMGMIGHPDRCAISNAPRRNLPILFCRAFMRVPSGAMAMAKPWSRRCTAVLINWSRLKNPLPALPWSKNRVPVSFSKGPSTRFFASAGLAMPTTSCCNKVHMITGSKPL